MASKKRTDKTPPSPTTTVPKSGADLIRDIFTGANTPQGPVAPTTTAPRSTTTAPKKSSPSTTTPKKSTTTTTPSATLPPASPTTSSPKSTTTTVPASKGTPSSKSGPSFREIEERDKNYQPPKEDKPGKKSKKDGKKKTEETADTAAAPTLEENVRRLYPQFSYLLDNPELFGDDVLAVIKRAVKDGWTSTRFQGAIQSTKYWQTTVADAKNFDALTPADQDVKVQDTIDEINKIVDMGTISEQELTKFARDMARRGIKGENLKKLTYGMALSAGASAETVTDVLSSNDAVTMKKVARAYGGNLSDDQVKQYLTEGKTPQQVQMMYREKAKGLYPHLTAQFDADLTMDDILSDYKSMAASVLERSETDIDFTKPEFLEAIATDDGKGNKRQLTLGEWNKKLKTDDRYGYSKTTRAIQDARQIAFNISKAFGKVI